MKKTVCSIVILLFVAFVSCNDIIERDLKKHAIDITSPSDNYKSSSYLVVFGWEPLHGALRYRLQVAKPNFSSLQSIIVDTVISFDHAKAYITFFPGEYEWRLRAENGSSQTLFITRKLSIDTTQDLSNQPFTTTSPTNYFFTNNQIIRFSWPAFPYANQFEFLLTDTNKYKVKSITTNLSNHTDTLNEGWYLWSAKAINTSNNTSTNYSTPRYILVDITSPRTPTLLSPINNTLLPNPVMLTWNKDTDVVQDSILIASDSLFQNIDYSVLVTDSLSHVLPTLPINSSFFWKIKSKDRAGNWSLYSNIYRFSISQ